MKALSKINQKGETTMLTILKERFMNFSDQRSVVIAELAVDTKAELPTVNGIDGRTLGQGSLAWEVSTGTFYGLMSSGVWVDQTTGDTYDPDEQDGE